MEHILKQTHIELERTHRLVDNYKLSGFGERFFSLISRNFPKILNEYAQKKERLLLEYSSLATDIQKKSSDHQALTINVRDIGESITQLTNDIESCGQVLEKLISHSKKQEDIIHHEKVFFVNLLESFNIDLQDWVASFERNIFGNTTSLKENTLKNPLSRGKKLLFLQKERLEKYIKSIS